MARFPPPAMMMNNVAPITDPGHDYRWLRRFWLASASVLTLAAGAALALGLIDSNEAAAAGAFVLAAFGVWLTIARVRVGHGHEGRLVVLASGGQYILMLALLPLIPELAAVIVPAALIPVFVASPHLKQKELTRYSAAVWVLAAVYTLAAFAIVSGRQHRGITDGGGVVPAAQSALVEYANRMDVAFFAQLLGALVVVAIMLRLLLRYSAANRDVHHLALHDSLTGLANRTLFMDRLGHALERGLRHHSGIAVVFIDVDEFKAINDRHGHGYGDDVLRGVADRIRSDTRASDTVARVGGDEFAILLEDIQDPAEAAALAERLKATLERPMELTDGVLPVRVSMGVAFDGDGGPTPDALLQSADDAMYESKRLGDGGLVVYRPAMNTPSAERRALKRAFRGVVERGELRLQFQPFIDFRAGAGPGASAHPGPGAIVGVEALVRWEDPDRGRQMPARFVSLAEETGDIVPIGRWVIQEAVKHVVAWRALLGQSHLFVAVNVSRRQVQDQDFERDVAEVLSKFGLPPTDLILEITEDAIGPDMPAPFAALQELRTLGVRLAIDDYGSGHSSLSTLKDFKADLIKLDRSLVADAVRSRTSAAVLRTTVDLGEALDAMVVAEGIETSEQLDLLTSLACDLGQGFLFAPPLDPEAVAALLAAESKPWENLFQVHRSETAKKVGRSIEMALPPLGVGQGRQASRLGDY